MRHQIEVWRFFESELLDTPAGNTVEDGLQYKLNPYLDELEEEGLKVATMTHSAVAKGDDIVHIYSFLLKKKD